MAAQMTFGTEALSTDEGRKMLTQTGSDRDGLNELAIARGDNVWARFKFEWKWENLWFHGDYPNTYGRLHWPRAFGTAGSGCWCCSRARGHDERDVEYAMLSPGRWLVWRMIVTGYLTAIFVYSITKAFDNGEWFAYLTNWQSTIFLIYGWLSLASALYIYVRYRDTLEGDFKESAKAIGALNGSEVKFKIPLLVKTTWVFQGLAMSLGIWVTVMFWANVAVFGYYDPSRLAYNLLDHFSTIFIVLLDFSFASFPWLLFQFVWSAFIAIAFTIWSVIHYKLGMVNKFDGGHYLYKGLEWDNPVPTFFGIAILIVFGVPLVSITVWFLASESFTGRCAPKRIVPWVDVDGSGGHRLKSFPKEKAKKLGAVVAAVHDAEKKIEDV